MSPMASMAYYTKKNNFMDDREIQAYIDQSLSGFKQSGFLRMPSNQSINNNSNHHPYSYPNDGPSYYNDMYTEPPRNFNNHTSHATRVLNISFFFQILF